MCSKEKMLKEIKGKLNESGFPRTEGFIKALSDFITNEKFLLQNNLNERTLTAKLSCYIQNLFSDFNVDCEYNRMMDGKDYNTKKLGLEDIEERSIKANDTEQKTVFPDIIIHKRGDNSQNFVAIEAKKSSNRNDREIDFKKLRAFTDKDKLNYQFGFFIEFDEELISCFKIYKNGSEVNKTNGCV